MSKSKSKKPAKEMTKAENQMKKQSDAFYALPKNKQRIKVAMDVILLIKNRQIQFTSQSLVSFDEVASIEFRHGTQLKSYLDKILQKGQCCVCGVGACLISLVNLADKYKIDKNLSSHDCYTKQYKHVIKVFGKQNTYLIEAAFEMGGGSMPCYIKHVNFFDESHPAREFGKEYDDDGERLKAIMENIIENDGDFIPPPLKPVEGIVVEEKQSEKKVKKKK